MANYVLDHFTDADGTLLAAHTPDAGGAWHGYTNDPQIIGNQCAAFAFTTCRAYNDAAPATDDYQVSADLTMNSPSSGNVCGVTGRDTSEFGAYRAYFDFAAATWTLAESFTTLGTFADSGFTSGVTRHVVLKMVGTTITVNIDGVDQIVVTDSSQTTGFGGILSAGGSADGATVDNFSVDDVAAGPPPGTHVLTGRGSDALSGTTAWLSTAITGRPDQLTSGLAEPPNWYHVGMISWGTAASGAMTAYPVTRDLDLVQIPTGMDTIWYEFIGGVTATIVEKVTP